MQGSFGLAVQSHQLRCHCSDHANLLKETLEKQFEVVKNRTSRNGSYIQGSHVLQFGSLSIDEAPAGDYLGEANTGTCCLTSWTLHADHVTISHQLSDYTWHIAGKLVTLVL